METVPSWPKYRRLVALAKQHDFEICLVYVYLQTVEMQLDRIMARVAKGGHDVPAVKVAQRRVRSLEQCGWFFEQAERAWIFDNSGDSSSLVAHKETLEHGISAYSRFVDRPTIAELEDRIWPGKKAKRGKAK